MSARPRPQGRDVFLPVFLILVGIVALLVSASAQDWGVWEFILLAIPVFILAAGINLAVESRRLATAVVMTAAGAALLARYLGQVDWPVLPVLARAWPLVLVAIGLDLVIGKRTYLALALSALVGLVLVAVAAFVFSRPLIPAATGQARTLDYPLDDAAAAVITLDPGVGAVTINAAAEPASLLDGTIRPDPAGDLVAAQVTSNGSTRLSLTRRGTNAFNPTLIVPPFPEWDLAVASGVPLELNLDLGVGQCRVDLTGVQARQLEVSIGIGECVVLLPSMPDLRATIDSGIGRAEVVLPGDIEARVEVDTGITNTIVDGDLTEVSTDDDDEDEYVTPGYSTATARAEIRVEQGIGSLVIRRE